MTAARIEGIFILTAMGTKPDVIFNKMQTH
jgi:hypothetical protein